MSLFLVRFGVLAAAALMLAYQVVFLGGGLWTTSLTAWYAKPMLLGGALVLGIAIYGFRTTLAERPVWKDEAA